MGLAESGKSSRIPSLTLSWKCRRRGPWGRRLLGNLRPSGVGGLACFAGSPCPPESKPGPWGPWPHGQLRGCCRIPEAAHFSQRIEHGIPRHSCCCGLVPLGKCAGLVRAAPPPTAPRTVVSSWGRGSCDQPALTALPRCLLPSDWKHPFVGERT